MAVPVAGYRSPFPPQVGWLDRNLPFHTNFMRCRSNYGAFFVHVPKIDPEFNDPYSTQPGTRRRATPASSSSMRKLDDPDLVAADPAAPGVLGAADHGRSGICMLDAVLRENVTLVPTEIKTINETGIELQDGTHYDVDVIVFATGFHATEYLFPMTITGEGGQTVDQLWAEDGAKAYLGCMMPGFPNLWSIYGPNTNGALTVAAFHEMVTLFAMQGMEKLILEGERRSTSREEAYRRYND